MGHVFAERFDEKDKSRKENSSAMRSDKYRSAGSLSLCCIREQLYSELQSSRKNSLKTGVIGVAVKLVIIAWSALTRSVCLEKVLRLRTSLASSTTEDGRAACHDIVQRRHLICVTAQSLDRVRLTVKTEAQKDKPPWKRCSGVSQAMRLLTS